MAREFQITEKELQATSINVAGMLAASRQRFTERTDEDTLRLSEFAAGNISFEDLQNHFQKRLAAPRGTLERASIRAKQLTATEQNQFNLDSQAVNNFRDGIWGYSEFIDYFEGRQAEEEGGTDDFIAIDTVLNQARISQQRVKIENSFVSGFTDTREYFNSLKEFQDAYNPGSAIWQTTQDDILTAAQFAFDEFGEEMSRSIQEIVDNTNFQVSQAQRKFDKSGTELDSNSLDIIIKDADKLFEALGNIEPLKFDLGVFANEKSQAQFESNALSEVAHLVPFGTPFKSKDSPDVFLRTAQGIQRIQNEQEFFKQFGSFDVVKIIPSSIVNSISGITDQPIQPSELFRVEGAPAIFQTSGGTARAFANEDAFFNQGFKFGDEKVISQQEFDKRFTTGDLIF